VVRVEPIGQMRFSVPADAARELTLELQAFNAMRVRGRADADTSVGLEAGDFVIEIDGQALNDAAARRKTLETAMENTESVWVIQRGGIRRTVTLDGTKVYKAGFWLEPALAE
jgi:hypothetical protein